MDEVMDLLLILENFMQKYQKVTLLQLTFQVLERLLMMEIGIM